MENQNEPMLEEDLRINFEELDDQVDFESHMQSSQLSFSSQHSRRQDVDQIAYLKKRVASFHNQVQSQKQMQNLCHLAQLDLLDEESYL